MKQEHYDDSRLPFTESDIKEYLDAEIATTRLRMGEKFPTNSLMAFATLKSIVELRTLERVRLKLFGKESE